MPKAKILLLQTGHAIEPILSKCGDFQDHFENIISHNKLEIINWPIIDNNLLPPKKPSNYQGIIITGSASMLEEQAPWMLKSLDYVKSCLDTQTPLLGVCFGHQLLGAACDANIGPNPNGRANGTVKIKLKNNFFNLPEEFWAQVSHRDVILNKSKYFDIIATANHDPHHAIFAGEFAWSVQFHPEWDSKVSGMYIDLREDILKDELGLEAFEKMRQSVKPTPEASKLLENFSTFCMER